MRYLMLVLLLAVSLAGFGKTPAQFLDGLNAPSFRAGHALKPLTRWSWPLSYDTNVALARWGYALDIDPGTTGQNLSNANSTASRLAALAGANPTVYTVSVNTRRALHESGFLNTLPADSFVYNSATGDKLLIEGRLGISPMISDEAIALVAAAEVPRLEALRAKCRIDLILNGGEYGMVVAGNNGGTWRQDTTINAALDAHPGDALGVWLSEQKRRQEEPIKTACIAAAGGNVPYVYYVTGDTRRGLAAGRWTWSLDFTDLQHVSSYPSFQAYYPLDGWWTWGTTYEPDILSLVLCGAAQGIRDGQPLSYHWLTAGSSLTNPARVSPDDLYMGFLKCCYTAGMVGATAGYFTYPPGGFDADQATLPIWLKQCVLLGSVHALFTHYDAFLTSGDLLPGPNMGRISTDLPAYELPTGDAAVRCVARKLRASSIWLVTVWVTSGNDRTVTVTVPNRGALTLRARRCGTVYHVTATGQRVLDAAVYPAYVLRPRTSY